MYCNETLKFQLIKVSISAGITRLNEEFSNEKISTLMTRLQVEILNLIIRMANEFPQRKEQLIFIIKVLYKSRTSK